MRARLQGASVTAPAEAKTIALIAEAQARGLTWAQIAPAIGCPDGKTAKAKAKRLARQAQAAMTRQDAEE